MKPASVVVCMFYLVRVEVLAAGCGTRWYKIFENDAEGNTVNGNKADLVDAVLHGAPIRVISNENYATSVQNAAVLDGNVFAQALFHISKAGYDRFQDNAYWWFVTFGTTGQWEMARYNVGEHTSRGQNLVQYAIQWFVRQTCNQIPILSITSEGKVLTGSIAEAVSAVKNAEDIQIISNDAYSFPADNLEYDTSETTVGAMGIWSVSLKTVTKGGTRVSSFQGNDYWWFTILSSNGQRKMSRWNIGEHKSRGASSDIVSQKWFSDTCWKQIYKHDGEGNQQSGKSSSLVQAVMNGNKVKLTYKRFSFEADEIRIWKGHVCASVLNSISKSGVSNFQSSVYWEWKQICTTGTVRTVRYKVGSNTYVDGITTESETIGWFTDDREWKKVLSTTECGETMSGSKEVLVHAVRNGAEVRYRLQFDGDDIEPGYSLFHQADNMGISGQEIGATHIRSISIERASEIKFQSNPYWWFTIISTTRRLDMSRWTVGVHEDRGHTSTHVKVEWFVNE